MTVVAFHRLAAREFRDAIHWYSERSPAAAKRFHLAVDSAVEAIRQMPERFPVERQRFRYARVHRFPYRLIFEQSDPQRILILAVAHNGRRPGYWRKRQ